MPMPGGNGQPVRRGPIPRVLDALSSVWLGILLATLLFVYCSIGSALPRVRMHPAVELTEFEWFHWWPFNLLIILFCTSLATATIRRIPLRAVNAGVLMIHTGIVLLAVGSYYYFTTKVEGDAAVFRRQVRIELPGADRPATLVALGGSELTVAANDGNWHFRVDSTNAAWPILSDEHKGETAYAVNVTVTPPQGEPFVRQLLDGYPQYTEDILPGKGRAIKTLGRKLIDADLVLTLELHPTDYFHVMDSWALFVRRLGEREWIERPIEGLPRYNEYVGARDQVFVDRHYDLKLRPLDLEVPAGSRPDALGNTQVRISGFLPYAQMRQRWRGGGEVPNPMLRLSLFTDHGQPQSYELMALDRRRNHLSNGLVDFRWVDDLSAVSDLNPGSQARLHIEVPGDDISLDVPLTAETVTGRRGPFTPIDGTPFAYRVLAVHDDLLIPSSGKMVSVAMMEIQTPDGTFTRMVADQPELTRDMPDRGQDPHAAGSDSPHRYDPRIVATYQPATAPLVFAAHPHGLYLAYKGRGERAHGQPVEPGEKIDLTGGLAVRVDAYFPRARSEVKPFIIPSHARRTDVGASYATVRVEVDTGDGFQTRWLPFHRYVLPNGNYAYGGRFAYQPEVFPMSDGTRVEVLFSRQRRRLPHSIALEDFQLDAHLGGYTGSAMTIRNYVSQLRFLNGGRWTEPRMVKVNSPTEDMGYWYFQSTWDKPATGDAASGMNYTGLGVGNRNGVWIQLFGCALAVIGMVFAFYVKPVMKRRRITRALARMADRPQKEDWVPEDASTIPTTEPVHPGLGLGPTPSSDQAGLKA